MDSNITQKHEGDHMLEEYHRTPNTETNFEEPEWAID